MCQSGPGSWPSFVYAQSAIYPMANSAAQVLTLLLLYLCGIFLHSPTKTHTRTHKDHVLMLRMLGYLNQMRLRKLTQTLHVVFMLFSFLLLLPLFFSIDSCKLLWPYFKWIPGCFWCYSWGHRLQNVCPRLWGYSRTRYHLPPWRLFLSYFLWYGGKTTVCIKIGILL